MKTYKLARGWIITAFLGAGMAIAGVAFAAIGPIAIDPLTVTRLEPASCQYRWEATFKNNGTEAFSGAAQATVGQHGASGLSLSLAPGETKKGDLQFTRKTATAAPLLVKASANGQNYGVRSVFLPDDMPDSALVFGKLSGTPTSFSMQVINKSAKGYAGDDVLFYAMSGPTPSGPWLKVGGETSLGCLAPSGIRHWGNSRPAGNRYLKAVLRRDTKVLLEQVFDGSGTVIAPNPNPPGGFIPRALLPL